MLILLNLRYGGHVHVHKCKCNAGVAAHQIEMEEYIIKRIMMKVCLTCVGFHIAGRLLMLLHLQRRHSAILSPTMTCVQYP